MKIAIVDDEKKFADEIETYILANDVNFIVEKFDSGETFLKSDIENFKIIILDIELGALSGIEVGKIIRDRGYKSLIIYVTSHTSYISEALHNQPFQYFIKPIQKTLFMKEFSLAVKKVKTMYKTLKITWNNEIINLRIGSIIYIEYECRRLHFFTNSPNEYLSLGKIAEVEQTLLDYNFIVCHKSFLVNMHYILEIKKDTILLYDGTILPLSRKHRQYVKEQFNFYLTKVSL